ncbi:glycosyltransferase family 4 protein [Streptomyces mirabilis]|uniref:glycosyltransferase family 4 protein n=1 Tax=Streptomyces mirabilis TaxID=68239 RepID=UPI003402B4CB
MNSTANAKRGRTVLHVVESWGGGVQTVVLDYVRAVPEARHYLLMHERDGCQVTGNAEDVFDGIWRMPDGHVARIREVGRRYRKLQPDVVHAHSSKAGTYVRLAMAVPTRRIIYTPHCYAMERSDLGQHASAAVQALERVLSRRTGTVAGVSPREVEMARTLHPRQRAIYIPNLMPCQNAPAVRAEPRSSGTDTAVGLPPLSVVAGGRLCAQKDPGFFAAAAAEGQRLLSHSHWYWLGGGEPRYREELELAGVEVTGWLDRLTFQRLLGQAGVYVHAALWEGAPMTLLEAAGLGRPVVARRTPALESLGIPSLIDMPEELAAAAVEALLREHQEEESPMAELLFENNPEHQRALLKYLYL